MVIPLPERFRWKYVVLYASVLFVLELAAGTNILFASLAQLYIFLFVLAFNAAGGLQYASGAFVFFTGVLVVLFGLTFKVFTGEAADSHLHVPVMTMLVYCGGMASMWAVATLTRKLRPRAGYLVGRDMERTMFTASAGCIVLGALLQLFFGSENASTATIGSVVRQINHFPQLAILLATTYEVRSSKGDRGWNWVVVVSVLWIFAGGVIYSSKEGMFAGPVAWLLAAWASGYNFRFKQVMLGLLFSWFMVYYMVPYSQYVRSFRDEGGSMQANGQVAREYALKLGEVRKLSQEVDDDGQYQEYPHLYDSPKGLADRLSMMPYDDKLTQITLEGSVFGLYPLWHAYINVVPHLLWPNKPVFFTANTYGHEVGVLSDEDFTTGISFSPIADAFHEATWFGVFVIFPPVLLMYFLLTDSMVGSVRDSPWPLLPIVLNAHLAPEGLVDGIVLQTTYGTLALVLLAWAVRYVFPVVVKVFTNSQRLAPARNFALGVRIDPSVRPLPMRRAEIDPQVP